jgi:hypothetical protein
MSTALMNKGLLTAQPQLLEECATYSSGHKLIYRLISSARSPLDNGRGGR